MSVAALAAAVAAVARASNPFDGGAGYTVPVVLHVRVQVPSDPEWVANLLDRLTRAPGFTRSPWRQSIHRYYLSTKQRPVHTVTSHDSEVDAIRVSHIATELVSITNAPATGPAAAASTTAPSLPPVGPSGPRRARAPNGTAGGMAGPAAGPAGLVGPVNPVNPVNPVGDRFLRLKWGTPSGKVMVVVSARRSVPVPVQDLPSRVDDLMLTTLQQACVFSAQMGDTDLTWQVEVGMTWPAASTTAVTQALKQGDDPAYTLLLTVGNVARAVHAHGTQYATLDILLKLADLLDVPLLQEDTLAGGLVGESACCDPHLPVCVPLYAPPALILTPESSLMGTPGPST